MKLKKLLVVALSLLMALALTSTITAADDEVEIVVENSYKDREYKVYKICDATVDGANIAYTIKDSDAWYALLNGSDSPFKLSQIGSTNKYAVTVAEGKTDTDVSDWLAGQTVPAAAQVAASGTGNGKSLTLAPAVKNGYYFITTGSGLAVTIDSVNDDIQENGILSIFEKNENLAEFDAVCNKASATIATEWTVTAKITNAVNYVVVEEDGSDTRAVDYYYIDIASAGNAVNGPYVTNAAFDNIDRSSIVVMVDENTLTLNTDYTLIEGTGSEAGTITAKINWTDEEGNFKYAAPSVITLTFNAEQNDGYNRLDEVPWSAAGSYSYSDQSEDIGNKNGTVKYYSIFVNKTNLDGEPLTGAKFELYGSADGNDKIGLVEYGEGVYYVANQESLNAAGYTSAVVEAGTNIEIVGLGKGTYYLEEIEAPNGYNPNDARKEINIDASDMSTTIQNAAGVKLPRTGGIGTTIFYVVGGVMVFGAFIILIARRRMDREDKNK